MNWQDEKHPIYKVIFGFYATVLMIVFSVTTATAVDETEYKMWTGFVIMLFGGIGSVPLLKKWFGIGEEEETKPVAKKKRTTKKKKG